MQEVSHVVSRKIGGVENVVCKWKATKPLDREEFGSREKVFAKKSVR